MPERLAIVGSFTTPDRRGRGRGLEIYKVNDADRWTRLCGIAMVNPSYLLYDPGRSTIFVAHGATDEISSLRLDLENGAVGLLSRQSTGGMNPVHLAISPDGDYLLAPAYGSGELIALPIAECGSLGPVAARISLPGTPGPVGNEQKASHPHKIAIDNSGKWLVIPDKGLDKIFTLTFDSRLRRFSIAQEFRTASGSGPRHAWFSKKFPIVYINNELNSRVGSYEIDASDGSLRLIGEQSTLPQGYSGPNATSEMILAESEESLFVANRGHDSVVHLTIDPIGGEISPAEHWYPSGGIWPRFLFLDRYSSRIYIGNQDGDNITSYCVSQSGRLFDQRLVVETGSPSSLILLGPGPG